MALCALLLASVAGMADAAICEKSVRWKDDAPYTFRSKDGSIRGIYADLVQEALERLECKTQFVEMPWARALVELEAGRLDILPGALKTAERERFAYFSRAVNRSPNVLFIGTAASKRFQIAALKDLLSTDFRLGAQIKVSYGPDYDTLMANEAFARKVTFISDRRGAWRMIAADRIDGLIADETTGRIEIHELGLDQAIAKSSVVVSNEASMVALSKATIDPDFVTRFNRAIETMLEDGSYVRIIERYIPCRASKETLGCK